MSALSENKAFSFLGLCRRAGQVTLGQDPCIAAVRNGNAAIVILDAEASGNTLQRVEDACRTHGVPLWIMRDRHPGEAIGNPNCMVLALSAGGMADKLLSLKESE